ncbi:hypothetical protein HDE_05256 [Halotydeus destructor]|nr:hypothetical protein HDE_05256 [Halotydeus destructor]
MLASYLTGGLKSTKVRARHSYYLSLNKTISIGIPAVNAAPYVVPTLGCDSSQRRSMLAVGEEEDGAVGSNVVNGWIIGVLKGSRYYLEPILRISPGHAENGTYKNGWLEYLQADRFDMVLSFVRLDSVTAPGAVIIGSTLFPADGAIVSKEQGAVEKFPTIAESFSNLETVSLSYIFFTTVVVLSLVTLSRTILEKDGRLQTSVTAVWLGIRCSLFQHNFNPTYLNQKIAFLALTCLMFFTIIGYFLGLMSTDQVASYPKRAIDTLEDLLDTEFAMYEPTLIDSLYLYDNFKIADPRSVLGRVHAKLMGDRYANVITIHESAYTDETGLAVMLYAPTFKRIMEQTKEGKRAILFEEAFLDLMRSFACLMNDDFDLHKSKESYLPGLFATVLSPKIDPLLRSYLQQRMDMLLESGVRKMALASFRAVWPQLAGKPWTMKVAQCAADYAEPFEGTIKPLRLTYLVVMVKFLLYSWAAALLVAVLEAVHSLSERRHGRRFHWKSLAYVSAAPVDWGSRRVPTEMPVVVSKVVNLHDTEDSGSASQAADVQD